MNLHQPTVLISSRTIPSRLLFLFAIASLTGFMLEPNPSQAFPTQEPETESSSLLEQRQQDATGRDSVGIETAAAVQPTAFIRIRLDDEGKEAALQTSITRYRPAEGEVIVDLIGAVHIGEGDYYRRLNDQFDLYDVVLYELVAPQGTRVPAGGNGAASHPIGMLQQSAQQMLGLESQLALIDYQKGNFVHADLSPEEMQQKMTERGDSALTVGLSALSEMIRNQNRTAQQNGATQQQQRRIESGADNELETAGQLMSTGLLEMMSDPKKMKLMMASQFASEGAMEQGLGQSLNQLLVTDRNEAAIQVLQQQLAAGKTKIAVFYGAAHMADFEQRLVRDFGLAKTDQVWVDAWDLQKEVDSAASSPMNLMMQMLKALDE